MKNKVFKNTCACVCVYACKYSQRPVRVWELELQAVVTAQQAARTELRSCARLVYTNQVPSAQEAEAGASL